MEPACRPLPTPAAAAPCAADQDSTDLQKCIQFVRQQAEERRLELRHLTLVALGEGLLHRCMGLHCLRRMFQPSVGPRLSHA